MSEIPDFLFWLLLLPLLVFERLQTFMAVDKNCLLLIDVFFLFLKSDKGLWFVEKYISKLCVHTVQVLGYL